MRTLRPRPARIALALAAILIAVSGVGAGEARGFAAPVGDPGAVPAPTVPAVLLTHGPRTRRVVALTFDDGYNPKACGALVDILERSATPATFFPNSVNVVRSPALWRRIAALGFPIGNHTANHPFMPRLGLQAQLAEIEKDRRLVEGIIGPSLLVFRPPYGALNRTTLLAAREAGYPIVLNWDASFADSSFRRDGRRWPVASYVRAASRGIAGSVVLGHCGNQIDVAALPSVIAAYRSRGFTFVTVPQLLGLPGATPMRFPVGPVQTVPPAPAPGTGPGASPSPSAGWTPGTAPVPSSSPSPSAAWTPGASSPPPRPEASPTPSPRASPDLAGVPLRWQSRVRTMPTP